MKRFLLSLVAVFLLSAPALAQGTLPPYINGTQDFGKDSIDFVGLQRVNANVGLTATASGTITTSQLLTRGYSHFSTVASGNDAARLPTMTGSVMFIVTNGAAANSLRIFPDSATSTINALGAGSGFDLAAGKTTTFIQATAGKWYTIPVAP